MTRVHILGAGTPTPTPTRFGSSFVVDVSGEQLMVDCGPATTHKLVKAGLWPTNIDHLFFTHHHFDHDVDFPCFLLCRWDQSIGKENRLQVYGPTLTEKITTGIIGENGIFSHDWKARVNFPGSQQVYVNRGGTLPRKPPDVVAKDISSGDIQSGKEWEMKSAHAVHAQPFLDSLAYRLDSPDGSIVFTGDTEPCDSVIQLARNADVMLCMCWDDQVSVEQNLESDGVCGTIDAAKMAQEAQVKKLVLVHVGPSLTGKAAMEKSIRDIKQVYEGELMFSEELMSFKI